MPHHQRITKRLLRLPSLVVFGFAIHVAAQTDEDAASVHPDDAPAAVPPPASATEPVTAPTPAEVPAAAPSNPPPSQPPPIAAFPADATPKPTLSPSASSRDDPERAHPAAAASTQPRPVSGPRRNAEPSQIGRSQPSDRDFEPSSRKNASQLYHASEPPKSQDDGAASDDLIRLGPLVGVGLPNLLSIAGLLKLTPYLGAGVHVGLIPSMKLSYYGEATLSYQEYDVFGRLFPFGGGFFLGAGVGYATIKGSMKSEFDTTSYQAAIPAGVSIPNPLVYDSQGSVRTMVLTPQLGYLYTADVGFSIGLDIGAQVPIAPSQIRYSSELVLPESTPQQVRDAVQTQYIAPSDKKVHDTLHTVGQTPLPTINLRVGWLF